MVGPILKPIIVHLQVRKYRWVCDNGESPNQIAHTHVCAVWSRPSLFALKETI